MIDAATTAATVASRLAAVRDRVAAAALGAGRDPASVRVVAVTKKLGAAAVRAAWAAGQRDFGENYVQEALAKVDELGGDVPGARWHLVGRLQSNKAAAAAGRFALLHGIDSMRTVASLSRAALGASLVVEVLLQVRLGRRGAGHEAGAGAARGGVEAEAAGDFLVEATAHAGVRFVGLTGVADPDLPARPQFASLRELAARLRRETPGGERLVELSMGMTGDFEEAIAEGATLVRIGTAIFGERPPA